MSADDLKPDDLKPGEIAAHSGSTGSDSVTTASKPGPDCEPNSEEPGPHPLYDQLMSGALPWPISSNPRSVFERFSPRPVTPESEAESLKCLRRMTLLQLKHLDDQWRRIYHRAEHRYGPGAATDDMHPAIELFREAKSKVRSIERIIDEKEAVIRAELEAQDQSPPAEIVLPTPIVSRPVGNVNGKPTDYPPTIATGVAAPAIAEIGVENSDHVGATAVPRAVNDTPAESADRAKDPKLATEGRRRPGPRPDSELKARVRKLVSPYGADWKGKSLGAVLGDLGAC